LVGGGGGPVGGGFPLSPPPPTDSVHVSQGTCRTPHLDCLPHSYFSLLGLYYGCFIDGTSPRSDKVCSQMVWGWHYTCFR
jgi:hypothetical protein